MIKVVGVRAAWVAALVFGACAPEVEKKTPQVASSVQALTPGIDLVIRQFDAPTSSEPNDSISIFTKICNEGDTFADWSDISFYLSTDSTIDTSDQLLHSIPLVPLYSGQCERLYLGLPIFAPNGAYHLGAIVDSLGLLAEGDETNNTFDTGDFGVGFGPDLVITELTSDRSSVSWGSVMRIRARVCNRGNQPGYADLSVYLSNDQIVNGYVEDYENRDAMLGTYFGYNLIGAGQCEIMGEVGYVFAAVNPPQTEGVYYLVGSLDELNAVPELVETNNEFVGQETGYGSGPDFVITEVAAPRSVVPGGMMSVAVTYCNRGTNYGVAPAIQLSVEPNNVLGMSSGGQILSPGDCARAQIPAIASIFGQDGAHELLATIDPNNQVVEVNEANNVFTGTILGVGTAPDLSITALWADPGVLPGQPFDATVTVCNYGTAPASGVGVRFLIWESYSGFLSSSQTFYPGQCREVRGEGFANVPAPFQGTFELVATVDPLGSIAELREDNNHSAERSINVDYAGEVVITAIKFPPTVEPWSQVPAAVTICNQGTSPVYGVDANVYITLDEHIEGMYSQYGLFEDVFIGTVHVAGTINPGRCKDATGIVSPMLPGDGYPEFYIAAIVNEQGTVGEPSFDRNDKFLGQKIGMGTYAGDLVLTSLSGPKTAAPSSIVSLNARICNQGPWQAEPTEIRVYLSHDDKLGSFSTGPAPMEPYIGSLFLDAPLPIGICRDISGNVAVHQPFGGDDERSYYLIGVVDQMNYQFELLESNNVFVGSKMNVGNGPDLRVASISAPASATPFASFQLTAEVCNDGNFQSSSAAVNFYLSADRTIDGVIETPWPSDDALIGTLNIANPIAAGACVTESVQVTAAVSANAPYYLGAIVNEAPSFGELSRANNEYVGPVLGVGHGADLLVTQIVGPRSAVQGQMASLVSTVCNQGTMASSPRQFSLYLSYDRDIELLRDAQWWSIEDTSLDTQAVMASIQPGQCIEVNSTVAIYQPEPFIDGPYYLAATIGETDFADLNPTNDLFVGGTIGVGSNPDLVVRAVRGPASAVPGALVEVDVEVCNEGTAPLTGGDVKVYVSADSNFGGDVFAGQTWINATLYPGHCRTESLDALLPPVSPGAFGPYYLAAIADENNSIPELNEGNNSFVGEVIGLGYGPDLVITNLTGPANSDGVSPMTVSVTLCNQGTEEASGASVSVYMVPNPNFPGMLQGEIFFSGPLLAGNCRVRTGVFTPSPPLPWYSHFYLRATVDPQGWVAELDETNNTLGGSEIGVGQAADLVITALTAPEGVAPGMPASVSMTLCNQGFATSWPTQVNTYLTADHVITPQWDWPPSPDVNFVSFYIEEELAAGQCVTKTGSHIVQTPSPYSPGGYFIAGIVDEYDAVYETNNANNTYFGTRIAIGSGPDLVVTALNAPDSAAPGTSVAIDATVCNRGTSAAAQASVSLYFSADSQIEGSLLAAWPSQDALLGQLNSVGSVAAGTCAVLSGSFEVVLPQFGSDGTYYLGAIADEANNLLETVEDNNIFVGEQLGVGAGPDLVVTAIAGPPMITPYSSFNVSSTVCNIGTFAAGPQEMGIYHDGIRIGSRLVGNLAAGACSSATVFVPNATFYPDSGYGLVGVADDLGAVSELNEANNSFAGARMIVDMFFCGNGWIDANEECDDENFVSGDGCTANCIDEYCGDNVINDGPLENCDDGNSTSGDGCSATCRVEYCGDGIVSGSEQCDDANNVNGDGCTIACVNEYCGDGTVNDSGVEECDDGNTTNWDGCSSTCERESPRFGEVGTIQASQPNRATWHTVNLQRTYKNPVVIMENVGTNDAEFAHLRVRNVTGTSFQWQIEEWQYQDGLHGTETVNYLVVEAGRRAMEDGTIIEAGITTANHTWKQVNFSQPFGVSPVVFTSVNSTVDPVPVITRTRGNAVTAFQVMVQEEEAQPQAHGTETVSWVAISPGNGMNNGRSFQSARTADAVTNVLYAVNFTPAFATTPVLFTHADRQDAIDTVAARWSLLTSSSFRVRMEEETSLASETVHTSESVNWMAWASPGFVTFEAAAHEAPLCNDLLDNDGDGLLDCADAECLHVSPCP